MRRVAVYTGSRNLYQQMAVAIYSLESHADLDKGYLLIQDDEFPYRVPAHWEIRNVSNQKYFPQGGPNMNSCFTYFAMMRAALPFQLKDESTVLSLDVDTIVVDDINSLWEINLQPYYFAGVRTPNPRKKYKYYNAGVFLLNLDKLRNGAGSRIVDILNNRKMTWVDEQAYNEVCREKALELSSDYNVCIFSKEAKHPRIIHYAGMHEWDKMKDYVDAKTAMERAYTRIYSGN